ncbi:hypothetical protein [Exiguobacterium sp. s191]|uniref:hypothetical protein n=1 Tax=Exiguobacterium sp. s191 TaxID=2751196 RepID=UPI001BEB4407|nr:hypothetical protein [Exiguobacterium sp. s191]
MKFSIFLLLKISMFYEKGNAINVMIKVIIIKVRLIKRLIVSPIFCFIVVLNIAKKESKTKNALKKTENITGFIEKLSKKNE